MSDSLWPHELQYARLPSPSLSPRTISNSCPSSNLIFVALFSCPQNFSASGSFPISWLFTSNDQSIGASASVLPMNIQDQFPWTGLISLQSKGLLKIFSKPQFESINSLVLSLLYGPTLTFVHDYWKSHSFD